MKFELEIIRWLQSFRTNVLDYIFQSFTFFGEEVILIVVLGFVYWCYNKKIGERLGLTLFLSLTFNSLIKIIVMRPRPFLVDSQITPVRLETAGGYSFPSGHTQSAATLFFGLFYFIKKKWLLVVAIVITSLVALSRMYLGVHYLTDVLVGGILGLVFAYGASKLLTDKLNYKKIYIITLIILVTAYIVLLIVNSVKLIDDNLGFLAPEFYFNLESLTKMFGTVVGFIVGILYEKKFVNFSNHNNIKKNIIRFLIGIGIILLCRFSLKWLFALIVDPDKLANGEFLKSLFALLFDFIRYFTMVFIGIGIYPKLFKKIHI